MPVAEYSDTSTAARRRAMHSPVVARALLILALCLPAGRIAAQDARLAEARALIDRLAPTSDARPIQLAASEMDHAIALLSALVARGQDPAATREDWAWLHRAIDALIGINIARGETFRASIYASLQDLSYRNYEGDYAAALRAARQALDLHERSGVRENLHLSIGAVARDLVGLGRLGEAIVEYRRALARHPEPASAGAARTRHDLVQVLLAAGDVREAEREVRAFAAAPSTTPLFRARARLAASDLLMSRGDYRAALDAIDRAREAAGDQAADPGFGLEVANQLMQAVLASMRTLPYADAVALAQRLDADRPGLPIPIGPFAQLAVRVRQRLAGDLDAVLRDDLARLARAQDTRAIGAQVEAWRSLAATYRAAHNGREQVAALEQARELQMAVMRETVGGPRADVERRAWFSILISLGDAYADRCDPDPRQEGCDLGRARDRFSEVTAAMRGVTAGSAGLDLASLNRDARRGLARVAALDGDESEAITLLEEILTDPSAGMSDRAQTFLQLARRHRARRAADEMSTAYARAVAAFESTGDRAAEMFARLEWGRALLSGAVPPAARALAADQLSNVRARLASFRVADAEWRLQMVEGMAAEAAGQLPQAAERYDRSLETLDVQRAGLPPSQRETFADSLWIEDLYGRAVAVALQMRRPDLAWRYAERSRARSFLESRAAAGAAPQEETPAAKRLADLEAEILNLRVRIDPRMPAAGGSSSELAQLRIAALQRAYVTTAQMAGGPVHVSATFKPADASAVARRIAGHVALIEYAFVPTGLVAFVLAEGRMRHVSIPVDPVALRRQVQDYRAVVGTAGDEASLAAIGQDLSEILIQPVWPLLPARVTEIVMVPAGLLNYVPFQALPSPDGGALIDRAALRYAPSATALDTRVRPVGKDALRVFIGALGNREVEGQPPLPGTLQEADAIQRVWPTATRVVEEAFTPARALSALRTDDIVHFATHGLIDSEAPAFSALLTAPDASGATRVSLHDLARVRSRARLVVLSACDTGLGRLTGGDEIAGLTRTLLAAGAESVVSTLWQVSDESTALLMETFYRHLREGRSPAAALQAAAKAVRATYSHPFHWAPFIATSLSRP